MNVVICGRFCSEAEALLRSNPKLALHLTTDNPEAKALASAEVLLIRSRTKISPEFLVGAPNLKHVITGTSGFDHIDLKACEIRGIKAYFCPDSNAQSAAELTWGLILSLVRKLPAANQALHAGSWNREPLVGQELHGKTLGVVGLGRIGRRVAQFGNAFGMRVIGFDPYVSNETFAELKVQRLAYTEVLRDAHILTFHVPSTKQTLRMINRSTLSEMTNDTLLVNASRGEIVCEDELIDALREGRLAGAALDVFTREPLDPTSQLAKLKNVILTPHIGALTHEAFRNSSREAAKKVFTVLEGEIASNSLPPQEPWILEPFGAKPAAH